MSDETSLDRTSESRSIASWSAAAFVFVVLAGIVRAQENAAGNAKPETTSSASTAHIDAAEKPWEFSATAFTYFVPEGRDYVSPIVTADRGWLHLEARYNYEALDTGSLFVGYNFSAGDELKLSATPMLGGVFGDTTGIAPGFEITLDYKGFELYTEGEYVFDTRDSSGNFFYSWSQLTYSPKDWLQVGLVAQRTRAYQTDLDIQRGLLLGITYKQFNVTAYMFNIASDDATYVFSIGLGA